MTWHRTGDWLAGRDVARARAVLFEKEAIAAPERVSIAKYFYSACEAVPERRCSGPTFRGENAMSNKSCGSNGKSATTAHPFSRRNLMKAGKRF